MQQEAGSVSAIFVQEVLCMSALKKVFVLVLAGILCAFMLSEVMAAEIEEVEVAPMNPEFLRWLEQRNNPAPKKDKAGTDTSEYPTGEIPSPVDNSHLWKDPPRPRSSAIPLDKSNSDNTLPKSYDLRLQNRVTDIRDQSPWGSCWSFASMATLESQLLTRNFANKPDLSEMHLAYFVYGDTRTGKSFYQKDKTENILDHGGNTGMAIALLSRAGFVSEDTLPYAGESYTPPDKLPEEYESSGFRLKEAYDLGVLSGDAMKDVVKNLIMTEGAVKISFFAGKGATSGNGTSTRFYFDNTNEDKTNHAVVLIGWDDDLPRTSFDENMRPEHNGAWLVRNSWGTDWGSEGYFWMSYEQYIASVTMLIPDKASKYLKQYGHDDLGYLSSIGFVLSSDDELRSYTAGIFKAETDEILQYVGFRTVNNNTTYSIDIYDLGTDKPTSPVSGSIIASVEGKDAPYAGYHTEDLSSLGVKLSEGTYFSVVVKTDKKNFALESSIKDYAEVTANPGESFYSYYGTKNSWTDAAVDQSSDVCVKAFTIPDAININDINFPDDIFRQYIADNFDTNTKDGLLTADETAAITKINVSSKNIFSLKGIELFTSLQELDCSINHLKTLDLSGNKSLHTAIFSPQTITGLKVTLQNGSYDVPLKDYVPDTAKIISVTDAQYDRTEGTAKFSSLPQSLTYEYDTGIKDSSGLGMMVTVNPDAKPSIVTTVLTDATDNEEYSFTLEAIGTETITWSIEDRKTLPEAFTLDNDGKFHGTYNGTGTFSFTVKAASSSGDDIRELSLTVKPIAPAITTENLTAIKAGEPYITNLTATGSTPITWAKAGDNWPSWLELNNSGTLSGTPDKEGEYKFTVSAENSGGRIEKELTIIVYALPVITANSELNFGVADKSYSEELTAAGSKPISWTLDSGSSLPEGLTLGTEGKISGIPKAAGEYIFSVTAKNSFGEAKQEFTIIVYDPPKITTGAELTYGITGTSYTANLIASGTKPITWTKTGGNLPSGLVLGNDGSISGKPETAGNYSFTVKAHNISGCDSERTFTIIVYAPPKITTEERLQDGTRRNYYSVGLEAEGSGTIHWVIEGDSPEWLELNNGIVCGTPEQQGSYSFTAKAYNDYGSDTKTFSIQINRGLVAPVITSSSPSEAYDGQEYNFELEAYGSDGYGLDSVPEWSLSGGELPEGLTLDSYGRITGTPRETGEFTFTVKAMHDGYAHEQTYTITINASVPEFDGENLPDAVVGSFYEFTPSIRGTKPISWDITENTLPYGLCLNADTGTISGIPEEAKTFSFCITASNSAGSDSRYFDLNVMGNGTDAPVITTEKLPLAVTNIPYRVQLEADSTEAVTWSIEEISNEWLEGLSIDKDGVISGIPRYDVWGYNGGRTGFTVKAKNSGGIARKYLELEFASEGLLPDKFTETGWLDQTSDPNKMLVVGENYYMFFTGYYRWDPGTMKTITSLKVVDGVFPPGLEISQGENYPVISGSPKEAGKYTFTLRGESIYSYEDKTYTVTVLDSYENLQPVITVNTLPDGAVGEKYYYDFYRDGADIYTSLFTWSITGGFCSSWASDD